jgi:acyl carrier protein
MSQDVRPRMDAEAIEARILAFLQGELLSPGTTVHREDDLLSGELLDSMSVLRLAAFVGQEFGIIVQPADFVVENFRNVAIIAAFVRRSQTPSGASR